MAKRSTVTSFDLQADMRLADKYDVISRLGSGWEGEVYLIRERSTGIERTAKLFFPKRNERDAASKFYAKKLHKLRHCPIIIQYSTQERVELETGAVTMLVSEYVEGELLSKFIARQPSKRLSAFAALHLLHALATGMERIHAQGEYHGDLHSDNVIIQRYGLSFDLKLVDFFRLGPARKEYIQYDVIDLVHLFYEALGGKKYYANQPAEVKAICCGLKRTLILKKFKNAGRLRQYIETMEWG